MEYTPETKPDSLPPPHPSPSPSSSSSSYSIELTILITLLLCNIVFMVPFLYTPPHHSSHGPSFDFDLLGMDCFSSLAVDLKKAFREERFHEIASYPSRLAEATGARLVSSVLPEDIFLSIDTFLNYDYVSWTELGTNFTYKIAQSCWEVDDHHFSTNKQCNAIDTGNAFSIVSSFMRKVSDVTPLEGATRNVPVQTSWLGGLILYLPNDLYNVMENSEQWYKTFSDCEVLLESYSKADWSGQYYDPNGKGHHWSCGGCSGVMKTISQSCHILARASNQTGPPDF